MGFFEKAPINQEDERKREVRETLAIQKAIRERYYQEAIIGAGSLLAIETFGNNYQIQQQSQTWRFNVQEQIKDFLLKNPELKNLLLNSIPVKIENRIEFIKSLEEKIVRYYKETISKQPIQETNKRAQK